MSEITKALEVLLKDLAAIAVEFWRLNRWVSAQFNEKAVLPVRHTARSLEQLLGHYEIQIFDLTGQPYDAGLALEVLDTICLPEPAMEFRLVIEETISPLVLWREQIILPGQVILRQIATESLCTVSKEEPT